MSQPASRTADIVGNDRHPSSGARSNARAARLYYQMMRRLPRVRGIGPVADLVLRHAARAVDATMGALAVTRADGHAGIVATFGYPRALVEHIRIEQGSGVIGQVIESR